MGRSGTRLEISSSTHIHRTREGVGPPTKKKKTVRMCINVFMMFSSIYSVYMSLFSKFNCHQQSPLPIRHGTTAAPGVCCSLGSPTPAGRGRSSGVPSACSSRQAGSRWWPGFPEKNGMFGGKDGKGIGRPQSMAIFRGDTGG